MATDILIVSYHRDAKWLEYCLRSVEKHARQFRQTVVVYPTRDQFVLAPVCSAHPNVRQSTFEEDGDGHLWQNVIKTEADLFTDADFILHLDSDSVFTERFTPLDASTDGKPDIFYGRYGDHKSVPPHVPWKLVTQNAVGREVEVETMRRFPLMYPRWLYSATRQVVEQANEKPFREFVFSAPRLGGAWHAYCEFNTLGAVAYYWFHDRFKWRYFGHAEDDRPWKIRQFGSKSGLTEAERQELEKITNGYRVQAA